MEPVAMIDGHPSVLHRSTDRVLTVGVWLPELPTDGDRGFRPGEWRVRGRRRGGVAEGVYPPHCRKLNRTKRRVIDRKVVEPEQWHTRLRKVGLDVGSRSHRVPG